MTLQISIYANNVFQQAHNRIYTFCVHTEILIYRSFTLTYNLPTVSNDYNEIDKKSDKCYDKNTLKIIITIGNFINFATVVPENIVFVVKYVYLITG